MAEIDLKNYSFKCCIDWIDIEFFTGEISNGNGLREMLGGKKAGVTHVHDAKTNSKDILSNHFVVRVQNPTEDRLKKIEGTHKTGEGKIIKIRFGEIQVIEFAIDAYRRIHNEIPALELMAHYLTKTLHFKDTLSRKYRLFTNGKREGCVSKDTTIYVDRQGKLAARLYIKTTDDGTVTETPRCRLEFIESGSTLPCRTIAELSGVKWDAWIFETIRYLPRMPTNPDSELSLLKFLKENFVLPRLIGDSRGRYSKRGNELEGEVFSPPSKAVLIAPNTLPQNEFVRRIKAVLRAFKFA